MAETGKRPEQRHVRVQNNARVGNERGSCVRSKKFDRRSHGNWLIAARKLAVAIRVLASRGVGVYGTVQYTL